MERIKGGDMKTEKDRNALLIQSLEKMIASVKARQVEIEILKNKEDENEENELGGEGDENNEENVENAE